MFVSRNIVNKTSQLRFVSSKASCPFASAFKSKTDVVKNSSANYAAIPAPISAESVKLVQATVPILKQGGQTLTSHFYKRMFANDPEVKFLFNAGHQFSGEQPKALANSVLAYAENIEDLTPLLGAVELIAQKHCALGIWPEHYPIVKRNLLNSIVEVLGTEVATPAIQKAWFEAYDALAKILIAREAEIYRELESQPGGWNGKRPFVVKHKIFKGDKLSSLTLEPQDGLLIPTQKPGQYLTVYPTVEMYDKSQAPISPRNYTISSAPDGKSYRITIRRKEGNPPGIFSNYLIDHVKVGDVLMLGPPVGEFFLEKVESYTRPLVFIGGGVGLTPLVPMMEVATEKKNSGVHFYYGGVDSSTHPIIEQEIEALAKNGKIHRTVYYEKPLNGDKPDVVGQVNPKDIVAKVGKDAQFFVCGPAGFMHAMIDGLEAAGVDGGNIRFELFGPMLSF